MNELAQLALDNQYVKNKYLVFVILLVLLYILSRILVFIVKRIFLSIAKKTKTTIDDELIKRTHKPLIKVFVLFGTKIAMHVLGFSDEINKIIDNLIDTLIIILITVIVIRFVDILINAWGKTWAKKTKSSLDDELLPIFHRTSKVVFILLAIIFILKRWDIDVSGLLAGVGIAGIALSFAVKDSLANIFGGISIILDHTYKIGDIIKLDNGDSGKILNIGLRSTRIKTWDGEVMIIPNSIMANSKLVNIMQPDMKLRVNVEFGVEYGSDPEKVKKIVKSVVEKIDGVLKDPEVNVVFLSMGDFSLNFKVMFWVEDVSDKWPMHQKAINLIYKELNRKKIGIPFPTHTIYMKKSR